MSEPTPRTLAVSLLDEQRSLAKTRILRAARAVLARDGLNATIDDVATEAGVSRRTVFRHFDGRDALLAAAIADGIRSYGEHLPKPEPGGNTRRWLEDVLVAVHGMNARHGRIYWELAFAETLSEPLREADAARRAARRVFVEALARASWQAAGGRGRPPGWVLDAFAVHLSAYATAALAHDFGRTPEQAGRSAALVLDAVLEEAVRERSRR